MNLASEARHRAWIAPLALAVLMAGCASKPAPTVAQLDVALAADGNPDARGRPSPVHVRIYTLRSLAAFEAADFFALYDDDRAVLAADLASRDDLMLRPGESQPLTKTLPPDVGFIGVVAGLRDVERARWRAAMAVPAGQTTPLAVRVGADSVSLGAP